MTGAHGPLRVKRLTSTAIVPARQHPGDAGLDLTSIETLTLGPSSRATVATGLAIEVPEGWAGLVCPRSGAAARHGIGVVNAPGIIDAGYRGEVRVVLHNTDTEQPFEIAVGDRIAQLVLVPVGLHVVEETSELAEATRGSDGFGSTGRGS